MIFRWIEGDELKRLDPVMKKYGWTQFDPIFSKALIVEEDGEIIAFNVLQVVLRPEPIWVKAEHRGDEKGIAKELASKMTEHLLQSGARYWEVKTWSPWVANICKENGMEKITVPMYAGGLQ